MISTLQIDKKKKIAHDIIKQKRKKPEGFMLCNYLDGNVNEP